MVLFLVKYEDMHCNEKDLWNWLLNWSKTKVENPRDEKSIAKIMSNFIPFIHLGAMSPHFIEISIIPFLTFQKSARDYRPKKRKQRQMCMPFGDGVVNR